MAVSFEILGYSGRTIDYVGSLLRADGITPLVLATVDLLRMKIGRGPGTVPLLDLKSGIQTSNGSTLTITSFGSLGNPPSVPSAPATYDLHLAEGDMASLLPGCYDAELIVIDGVETLPANAMKEVSIGILQLWGTLAGATGP